ncbi:MAG: DNA-directed RNA polymerase subunit beta' [Candidatus Paceibacterota bacterium]|jgi:DNA-directed RNA polymerase subunit beta'
MEQKMYSKNAPLDFNAISLKLASPERIREWSHGEVTRPETINYRTQRSERSGLFDERIFGPEKDYECYCGKYRRIRYKDIICEKCGVEVTRSIVRRERMGHIELAAPVAHIWFVRGVPSRIGLLMDLSVTDLEKVIYFAGYLVTKVNDEEKKKILKDLDSEFRSKIKSSNSEEAKEAIRNSLSEVKKEIDSIKPGVVFDEVLYHKYSMRYGTLFDAEIGAEAIYKKFKELDLESIVGEIETRLEKAGTAERLKLNKRLQLVKSLIRAGVRPEWMFLTIIPVTPPALRPMVALDGGRHATSDINDLYRRVINRNNRLKRLVEINAPEVIQRNEKRILQEAVDALIDNSIRHGNGAASAVSQAQRRPLKSLADMLKGKQGRFRQNLLGKRVDYSGRSVIVVGPELKLNQCGLPKHMALELFRPFVISKILEQELAFNIRGAGKLIEEGAPEVWAILEEVIKNKYVLLNRAPTLHRLGIQAFKPVLIEGNAIQIHPMVCPAFNADFDGDQMAVHVPLSDEAQEEAGRLMSADKNLLFPGNGNPTTTPKMLDMVLGCYWMTKMVPGAKGEGKYFARPNAAIMAYEFGDVSLQAKVKLLGGTSEKYSIFKGELVETTVGRVFFNSILPSDYPFVNYEISAKEIAALVEELIAHYGAEAAPALLDRIKSFGYKYAMRSGITWGIDDVVVPKEKPEIIARGMAEARVVDDQYAEGLLSETERYRIMIELWRKVKDDVEKMVPIAMNPTGSVHDMVISKARGSMSQITQMAGMIGLIVNTQGRQLDFPVIPSWHEGLSPLEYFITTHGARKGNADTALNTAKSGYLTRRLVDVAQDSIVTHEDCGDQIGRAIERKHVVGLEPGIANAVRGRIIAKDIVNPDGGILFKKGVLLNKADAIIVDQSGIESVQVFTPLTCKSTRGMCRKCYGLDFGRNKQIELGEAVGVVAAQAIGEPGTQLTMRTFHVGGVAQAGGDITMGLPRVEEIFERRAPKNPAIISEIDGTVVDVKSVGRDKIIEVLSDDSRTTSTDSKTKEYIVPQVRSVKVSKGDTVKKGNLLTDGSANLAELFEFGGKVVVEDYIVNEVNRVYATQGATIARKHVEVIVRQMFSKRHVVNSGDTGLVAGETVDISTVADANKRAEAKGGKPAKVDVLLLGISEVALKTPSFLSAASFQNTARVLTETAVKGGVDHLRGLKENVIIGRLIPAGTGFRQSVQDRESKEEEE